MKTTIQNQKNKTNKFSFILEITILFLASYLTSQGIVLGRLYFSQKRVEQLRLLKDCRLKEGKKSFFARWDKFPIRMKIDKSVPEAARKQIYNAAQKWSIALGFEVFQFELANEAGKPSADNLSVIYFISEKWPGEKNHEADTFSRYQTVTERATEADILVNAENFRYAFDKATPGFVDFESLMLHEFGHVLGMEHIENGGVMNPYLAFGEVRRDFDRETLKVSSCIYASIQQKKTYAMGEAKALTR